MTNKYKNATLKKLSISAIIVLFIRRRQMGKYTEKWDGKLVDDDGNESYDPTHDLNGKAGDKVAHEFVGKKGDGANHCHLWQDKERGTTGVEHRGNCKVCDDEKAEKTWSDSSSTLSIVSRFFGGNG